jgi:hypothetical protein
MINLDYIAYAIDSGLTAKELFMALLKDKSKYKEMKHSCVSLRYKFNNRKSSIAIIINYGIESELIVQFISQQDYIFYGSGKFLGSYYNCEKDLHIRYSIFIGNLRKAKIDKILF